MPGARRAEKDNTYPEHRAIETRNRTLFLTKCASRRWSAWLCSRTQTRDESAALVSLAATQSR
eukprot:scaffold89202_cov69-Phaeocystis_antarctica.AAC.14